MPDQSSAATEHAILQEITGPLETLPDDPVALVHAEFPTAMRGYDRAAVDDHMQQMSQLVAELQATRSPEAAVRRALERVGEQISGILQRAHETAEQITAQSRREAEDRLEQARGEAAQIAGAAEQRVKDLDGDTDRIWLERQRIVADAEDLAGQLVALAKAAADRFPADEDVVEDTDAAPDETIPYDEEEPPRVTGASTFSDEDDEEVPDSDFVEPGDVDLRTAATQPEFSGEEEVEDFVEEDEDVVEPEPPVIDEIEKTVAFRPLEPRERDPEGDLPPRAETDSESTAIIPPASQAANRGRRRP